METDCKHTLKEACHGLPPGRQILIDAKADTFSLARFLEEAGGKRPLLLVDRAGEEFFPLLPQAADIPKPVRCTAENYPAGEKEAAAAAKSFLENGCDFLISCGSDAAINLAKAVKWFATKSVGRGTPAAHLAIPAAVGLGSEATGCCLLQNERKTIFLAEDSIVPDYVLRNGCVLQPALSPAPKSVLLGILARAVFALLLPDGKAGRACAQEAIRLLLDNYRAGLSGEEKALQQLMAAAYAAGRALWLAQATALQHLCWQVAAWQKIHPGYAFALCLAALWQNLLDYPESFTGPRESGRRAKVLAGLRRLFGAENDAGALSRYYVLLYELNPEAEAAESTGQAPPPDGIDPQALPFTFRQADLDNFFRAVQAEREVCPQCCRPGKA